MLFNPNYNAGNLQSLREIIQHIADDINLIYEEWHMIDTDCKLILPDNSISSFSKEAKTCALDNICDFFISLLKNKKVDLGVDMFPTFYEITTKIAKLYYETKNETYKSNAMDVLQFINNSDKYSRLLENVQHPANQNIYIETRIAKKNNHNEGEQGQKSNKLTAKLIQLAYSTDMIEQKEREFELLVMWVTKIDLRINHIMTNQAKVSGDKFNLKSFENVSYFPIVSSFMALLDSKCLGRDLHITGLTLLRKIVEVENKEIVTPSADWQGDDWVDYKKIIRAKQDSLVKIGCIEFLCKHIQDIDDDEILEQTFLVCITLLLGGNIKSQDAFFNYFQIQDPQNIIMIKLKRLLME